jgi:O-antigen/teichoic acid export membrane protein
VAFGQLGRRRRELVTEQPAVGPEVLAVSVESLGRERWRRIWRAAFGAAAFRGVSMVGTFVTIPLVLDELGPTRFGVFVLVTQLATLLVFSDLGLGNGLITALAGARADGDERRARELVSSTWALLLLVALGGGVLFGLLFPLIPWSALLGVDGVGSQVVSMSVLVFGVLFLIGVPASIAQKVHLACQEGLQANAWQTLGALLTIGGTVLCVTASASVPWFVAAAVGGSVVAGVANTLWLFRSHPELRPGRRHVTRERTRFVAGSGVLFLLLGVAGAVAYQTDALVISHVLSPADVTTYSLALRLFAIPGLAVSFVLAPLWPAFGDAFARHDLPWVRQTLRRAITWGAAVNIPGALLLVLLGQWLVDLWVGPGEVEMPTLLLVSFGIWTVLNTVSGPLAMLLNGAHVVRFQVVCAVAMAVVNLPLSIVLTQWLGVAGPILGSAIAQTLCIVVPSLLYTARLLRA